MIAKVTDKKSYIQFTNEWKAIYSFVSDEIRRFKKMQNDISLKPTGNKPTYRSLHEARAKLQSQTQLFRTQARSLMLMREEVKAMRPKKKVA